MATKGEYRYTTDKEGNVYVQRFGIDKKSGVGSWYDQKLPDGALMSKVPEGKAMSGGNITGRNENIQKKLKRDAENRARMLYNRGAASKARSEKASKMGFLESALIGAGRETDKLLAGAGNIGDFLQSTFTPFDESAMVRTSKRSKEQAEKDRLFKELGEEQTLATNIGGMAPYMVTGATGGPAASKAVANVFNRTGKVVEAGAKTGKSLVGRGARGLANKPGKVGQLGDEIAEDIIMPMERRAMRKSKQKKYSNPYREKALSDIIGAGGLGAAEGAVHYDMNPVEGAISSMMGAASGAAISPLVSKSPNYWGENQQRLVDWGKDQGMQFTPGMEKGSKRLQKFEAGVRESGDYADIMGQYDRANQDVMNRVAWEAAGVPEGQVKSMTPENLSKHMDDLKSKYQKLEADTTGRFTARNMKELRDTVEQLKPNTSKEGQKAYKVANKYLEQMESMYKPVRNKRGRMTKATFDGKQYQDLRRNMKEEMDAAFKSDKPFIPGALKNMINIFDQGLENGIREFGGTAQATQWKELNEKYAMTKLLIEKGTNIQGDIDVRKLGQSLMATDAERTLLEKGGRIQDLQRLAKIEDMAKNQAGSGLSGANIHPIRQSGAQTSLQAFMQTPVAGMVPLLPSAYMQMYKRGIPSTTGLLNMSRDNKYWNPVRIGRAAQQSTQLYPETYESIMNAADSISGLLGLANEEDKD